MGEEKGVAGFHCHQENCQIKQLLSKKIIK